MLAKLKYLKEEEKALKDIEGMVIQQVERLQQEEFYLKSLLRGSSRAQVVLPQTSVHVTQPAELFDDSTVNLVPLDDLRSTSGQQFEAGVTTETKQRQENDKMEEEEEEEAADDNEEMNSEYEELGGEEINKDLMKLMNQIQGSDDYEEFEDDSG